MIGHARRAQQGVELVKHLDAPGEARDGGQGPREGGLHVSRGRQLVEAHVIGDVHEPERLLAELLAGRAGFEQRREGQHRTADDGPCRHVEDLQGLGEQAHDLRLGGDPLPAHELDAELRELARLAGERGLLAHDGSAVAQAQGQLALGDAGGHHARDGEGDVRPHDQDVAVGVKEAERRGGHMATPLE